MRRSLLLYWLVITLTACHLPALSVNSRRQVDDPSPSPEQQVVVLPSPTLTPSVQPPTATATVTPSQTPSPTPTPYGCERPPDDYTLVTVGEFTLNQRTLWMLQHAQQLYGGTHDLVRAVTQGSYSPGVSASFGTHDGGGAVDLSVRDLNDWNHILYEDLHKIILALRQAGFAAWVRWPDVLYPGSPIHIHAIAIGDADLSPAARDQLIGPDGYFRGFNGLPVEPPQPDEYGGPYICPWMIEMGYQDLRGQP
jgi:hypothetical protein